MIELLIQILRFAAESPQNALVVIGFVGAFGMFAPKIPPPVREQRRETPRNAKGREKRTARKNRAVVKKYLTTEKRKKDKSWFVPPPLSPWQDALLTQYRVGRDFTFQN